MPNFAALRAAVFSLFKKNRRGGGGNQPPPPGRARVKEAIPPRPSLRALESPIAADALQNGHGVVHDVTGCVTDSRVYTNRRGVPAQERLHDVVGDVLQRLSAVEARRLAFEYTSSWENAYRRSCWRFAWQARTNSESFSAGNIYHSATLRSDFINRAKGINRQAVNAFYKVWRQSRGVARARRDKCSTSTRRMVTNFRLWVCVCVCQLSQPTMPSLPRGGETWHIGLFLQKQS